MAWIVDFYEDADGNCPVEEFLDGLPDKQRAKLLGLNWGTEKARTHATFPVFLAGGRKGERT
jgi:hypothetical protein